MKGFKLITTIGKIVTLGCVIWGIVEISQEISRFHKDGKFKQCKDIYYEKCDEYVCKGCTREKECDDWVTRNNRTHCVHYRYYWTCGYCLPINDSSAGSNGYNKACKYCTAIEDEDDRKYEIDFECDKCNGYSPPYSKPTCVNASVEHCTHGGPLYPFQPRGEDEGYLCLDGYNSSDTHQGTLFTNPNHIFNVFDYHGKILYYSIYLCTHCSHSYILGSLY